MKTLIIFIIWTVLTFSPTIFFYYVTWITSEYVPVMFIIQMLVIWGVLEDLKK